MKYHGMLQANLSWHTGLALAALALLGNQAGAADPLEFNRDVRPILAENCFACHGPDSAARKKALRLDRREDALHAEAFVPGQPEKSAILERVLTADPKKVMPPPKTRKSLTAAQKDVLRRWIASGAEYQPHWSLIAPKRPQPPAVKTAGWARTAIDRFILADLEKRGLQPAPEADRRTLARRLSLDLTGLPPAPTFTPPSARARATRCRCRSTASRARSPSPPAWRGSRATSPPAR